jgi:hypothetical protein
MIIKSQKQSRPEKAPQAAVKSVKPNVRNKNSDNEKSGGGLIKNFFFMLFFLVIASVVYLELFGIPGPLRGKIPQSIVDFLGLSEETAATQALREAGAPKLTAFGVRSDDPSVPVNGSVEEIVKTMRPDIYFRNKDTLSYREQPLNNRSTYQKHAFHIMLSTFYRATPDGVGFLDLAYQAPNFYFIRAVSQDSRTRYAFMDQLRNKVADWMITDSVTYRDGSVEFSIHGNFQQPKLPEFRSLPLVEYSKVNSEIFALRSLAAANQVRLNGLEKPSEENLGVYKRVVLKTTTEADYPSLLNFADALQKSDIAFGVQKFVSRPSGPEKMQSVMEFVLYASSR